MTLTTTDARRIGGRSPFWLGLLSAVLGGLVLGGLTQLGQTYLPEWLRSMSNSGAPWVLIAFALALIGSSAWAAALGGFLTLACLEIGYVMAAASRDLPSASTTVIFWLMAAVVFGPLAGLAAYFFRAGIPPWGAIGGGFVAGVVSGEGLVSYLTVKETTTPGYWIGQMIVGVVLLALVGRRAGFRWSAVAFVIGVCALVATRYVPVFGA